MVCRRWREVGETPSLWSQLKVTIRVDEKKQSQVCEILSSRTMEDVNRIIIGNEIDRNKIVSLSEKGWRSVIEHKALNDLWIMKGVIIGMEPELVGRVVTSMEAVELRELFMTKEQLTALCNAICDR